MPAKALRIARTVFLWLFTVFLALTMSLVGVGKLTGQDPWPRYFDAWGYPGWLLILIGLLQVTGGITILIPRVAGFGAAWLWIVMVGALATELTHEVGFGPRMPIVYITLLSVVLWLRRGTLLSAVQRVTRGSHAEVARA